MHHCLLNRTMNGEDNAVKEQYNSKNNCEVVQAQHSNVGQEEVDDPAYDGDDELSDDEEQDAEVDHEGRKRNMQLLQSRAKLASKEVSNTPEKVTCTWTSRCNYTVLFANP